MEKGECERCWADDDVAIWPGGPATRSVAGLFLCPDCTHEMELREREGR